MTTQTPERRTPTHPIAARFPGNCSACGRGHIRPGDLIRNIFGGYAAIDCLARREAITALTTRIERDMRDREGVALGVFGIPAGCRATHTRAAFYRAALQAERCTLAEYTAIANYYTGLGIWDRALDD